MNDDGKSSPSGERRLAHSSSGGVCVACGSTLGPGGPEHGCLNCLARFALSADDETERTSARTFAHFEVVTGPDGWPVKLGRGAMGVTYRARDTVLHTEVALKVIDINVAGHPAARTAFLREARAAAVLRHPNVASVFHYGEQDGECFYAMELVEGETLEARLRREGPLPTGRVLEIGRQVACALMEAEALGIVHRDLKPSNLMYVARRGDRAGDPPHIKVIDFGLAQAVDLAEAEEGRIAPAGFVGTPSFASPEQFAPTAGPPVDTRSDIYSLGVTFWYLLCGKLPFSGSALANLPDQRARPALPLEQLRVARVPASVVALVQRMLRVDPRERPPSARNLVDLIVGCQARISRGRRGLFYSAALAGLAALIVALTIHPAGPKARFDHAKGVAVLPFQNLNPNGAEAFYTTGVQDEIIAGLGRIGDLTIIGPESTRNYPPGSRDLGKISRELGVDHLIEGSVSRESDRVQITVRLIDPRDVSRAWTKRYEGNLADGFSLQARLTNELAHQLRDHLAPGVSAAIEEPPTADPKAHDLYLRAMDSPSMVRNAEEFVQAYNARLMSLEEAVERDPQFVLAYCAMAEAHDELALSDQIPEVSTVDHRALAEIALEKARRLQPDAGPVHRELARHLFSVTHDLAQARIELDLARATLPNDARVEVLAGKIARAQGHWDEAIRALEKAASLEPRDESTLSRLSDAYFRTRRYEDADRAEARVLEIASAVTVPFYRLERALGPLDGRADLAPLREALADLARSGGPPDTSYSILYQVIAALYARDPEALTRSLTLVQAEPLGAENIVAVGWVYPKPWLRGLAARLRGDDLAAREAFLAARPALEEMLTADPRRVEALSLLAIADAGLGRKEDALREGRRASDIVLENPTGKAAAVRCHLAIVYAWTGQPDEALALLDELTRQPAGRALCYEPTYGDLRLDPVWDPLRDDPRFAALVARLAPPTTTKTPLRRPPPRAVIVPGISRQAAAFCTSAETTSGTFLR